MDKALTLIADNIGRIDDYPKPGIIFRDITPLLAHAEAFAACIDVLAQRYREQGITQVCGIEARGFIFASALAYRIGAGFVPLRKPGKLPRQTYSRQYALEYGDDELQVHRDALTTADKVVVIDDLLATGGTALAAAQLVQDCGAQLQELAFIITLNDLPGVSKLAQAGLPSYTLCRF
ncbi:adenine phosphoribosyltransferase [Idiomarina xiamenensis]|nr:adenine phosphoribosyltransferase [Idiomarina xiamenensis]